MKALVRSSPKSPLLGTFHKQLPCKVYCFVAWWYILAIRKAAAFVPARSISHTNTFTSRTKSNTCYNILAKSSIGTTCYKSPSQHNLSAANSANENEFNSSGIISGHPHVNFISPLINDGYPPAVLEYENSLKKQQDQTATNEMNGFKSKPILLYLPGFDGTLMAPFLQFPSLGEEFDVRGLTIGMEDRSTFNELKEIVLQYVIGECGNDGICTRAIYLMGESFGGILATEVALTLRLSQKYKHVQLKGLILVNPATCYLRSNLYQCGPSIANSQSQNPILSFAQYVYSLTTQLVPLFLDEGRAVEQLIAILSLKGLPKVVNSEMREAYMGRVAFLLPNRLKFMPQETLKWRLEQWLDNGCKVWGDRLESIQLGREERADDGKTKDLLKVIQEMKTLIVAGELDLTLPSVDEAERLASDVFGDGAPNNNNVRVHVVSGAGHASTCGGSLHLVRILRDFFPELPDDENADDSLHNPSDELVGLVPRYDNASIGLSPLLYWSKENYRELNRET